MKKMILLFSHRLTQEQKDEAQSRLKVDQFVSLPQELQAIWSNISPDIASLKEPLESIKEFLVTNASKRDIVLVQGDFGAVYTMVYFCKKRDLTTVYATTKRENIEYINKKGEIMKKSKFEHVRFREYE